MSSVAIHQDQLAESRWTSPLAIAFYFATAKLLIHFLTNGQYDYVRDEYYFIAHSEHLDWGYVDVAPLAPLMAKLTRTLLGESLFALRFFPAVAGAAKVLLTGLLVLEFGGGRFAVLLACLCVLLAPGYLHIDTIFSTNAFEPLFWMGCAFCLIRAVGRNDSRYAFWFGVCAGVGLENKHSMLFFGFAIFVGLLLTSARRLLADKWLWTGSAVAFALFLPNLIWQNQHDWATLELLRNIRESGINTVLSPWSYIGQQFLLLQPLSAPVWIAGLWFFFLDREGSRYRFLGITYLMVLMLMVALKGKHYYLMPIYPILFAGGAVVWDEVFQRKRILRWLRIAFPAFLVIGGLVAAPFALPILPIETYLRYQKALRFRPINVAAGQHAGRVPQHFADMFGWREMVAAVARVYHSLPHDERAKTAIFADNYGQAAAIDFFGPRYDLPKAISPHQNYYLWGPRDYTGEIMIVLGWERATAEKRCNHVQEAGMVKHPYSLFKERYTIFICRGLKQPLPKLWSRWKNWG